MEQTRPYEDSTNYPISLDGETLTVNDDISSSQRSLPTTFAVVPFPTPNMDMASILNPTPRSPKRSCNKAYTLEEIHFIQYCKEDLKLSWPEAEARFKEIFMDPARDVSMVGLQCRYYRAQSYPLFDIEGNPVLNDDGVIIMHNITVRHRGQKEGLRVPILDKDQRPIYDGESHIFVRELSEEELHGPLGLNLHTTYQKYFKLVDRVPEHIAKYRWIRNEHKTMAKRNAKYNEDHGIELPGAVLPGGVELEKILGSEEIVHHKAADESSENVSNLNPARRSMPLRPRHHLCQSPKL